jgi:hypothetical protein
MKSIGYLSVTLLLLNILCGGCAAHSRVSTTLTELVSQPDKFNDKTITVDGIYVIGWEWTVLADDIKFTGSGNPKELNVIGNSIWFAGIIPPDIMSRLYQYTSPAAGPQHFGKIRVTGRFESGKYGNWDEYKYRITASKVELLDWTPPE